MPSNKKIKLMKTRSIIENKDIHFINILCENNKYN